MRAAYLEKTGSPEVIQVGELPRPKLGPGQVLVKVGASALNPIDLYFRSGFLPILSPLPYVIGSDFAGTVEEVDPGSKRFRKGDRVWGSNQGMFGRQGTAAEFIAVDEDWLYPTSDVVSDAEAAAMALVGITAHLGLFQHGRLSAGEKLYVPGGTGGVGAMVIQMAKAVGAKVATSCGTPEKVELSRKLGADLALNYKTDDLPARLREFAPDGLDLWFETQRDPNLEVSVPLLRKKGRIILIAGRTAKPILPLGPLYTRDCSLLGFAMFNASPDEQRRCADDMYRWCESGRLKGLVGQAFTLDQAAQAEEFLEANTVGGAGTLTGKVVISVA
ncbi:NADPH:quinone reductase [Singulisphaera rosea]